MYQRVEFAVLAAGVAAFGQIAQQRIVETIADIEDALDGFVQAPLALPLQFQESVLLDRPDGVAAMAAQLLFGTRYRREQGR